MPDRSTACAGVRVALEACEGAASRTPVHGRDRMYRCWLASMVCATVPLLGFQVCLTKQQQQRRRNGWACDGHRD